MPRVISERKDAIPALAEVFREHGFEGASLSLITERTGLGKGSLYHFFPGGKEEMAAAVLEDIDIWFENHVFRPLREDDDPAGAISQMFVTVNSYFQSGRRVCLVGTFALGDVRDRFASRICGYFTIWRAALAGALRRSGRESREADDIAEDVIAAIQGAIVASRALNDPALFERTLSRLESRLRKE
jgi:TetR/AcrR family transcriptional regulator, lmrAB and yxaGH operons repressor